MQDHIFVNTALYKFKHNLFCPPSLLSVAAVVNVVILIFFFFFFFLVCFLLFFLNIHFIAGFEVELRYAWIAYKMRGRTKYCCAMLG